MTQRNLPLLLSLVFALAANVDALCTCSCGGRSANIYDTCSVYSCERRFGNCPYGWRTYNRNGTIIGSSVGGFFFLMMALCCCCLFLRRRRQARMHRPMVQELHVPYGNNAPYGHQGGPMHHGGNNNNNQYPPPPGPPPPKSNSKFGGFFGKK